MTDDPGDRHITQRDLDGFREHVDVMFDHQKVQTEERFKSHRIQMFLSIGVAVGLLKFQVPDPITVGAIGFVAAKFVAFTYFQK